MRLSRSKVIAGPFSLVYYILWVGGFIYTMQNIKDNFETYFQYRSTITSQESRETDDQNVLFPNILLCSGNIFITCYDS